MITTRTVAFAAAALTLGAGLAGGLTAAGAATGAQASMHSVRTGGVTLRVPADWHLVRSQGPGCIVSADAAPAPEHDRPYGADNCQLRVLTSGPDLGSSADADYPYFPGDPAVCHSGGKSVRWATTRAYGSRVGRAGAEYRRFTLPCVSRPAEQWFVAGPPGIVIQRMSMNPRTESAARAAVAGAKVPARMVAHPRSVTGRPSAPGGTSVDIALVRVWHNGTPGTTGSTYVPGRAQALRVDVSHATVDYLDGSNRDRQLSPQQLLHDIRHGFPGGRRGYVPVLNAQSYTGERIDAVRVTLAARRH
jgi:hypothetical protein